MLTYWLVSGQTDKHLHLKLLQHIAMTPCFIVVNAMTSNNLITHVRLRIIWHMEIVNCFVWCAALSSKLCASKTRERIMNLMSDSCSQVLLYAVSLPTGKTQQRGTFILNTRCLGAMIRCLFQSKFRKCCFSSFNWWKVIIGSCIGLALNRRRRTINQIYDGHVPGYDML